jgi:hypothetical protein
MVLRALALAVLGVGLIAGAAVFWPGGGEAAAASLVNCNAPTTASPGEVKLLELINARRAQDGLAALSRSENLARAAKWKSIDQVAHFPPLDHTDSLGRDPFTRMAQCGYTAAAAMGEVIALTAPCSDASCEAGAADALELLMGHQPHRDIILGKSYRAAGVGLSGGIWTVDFASVDDSGTPATGGSPTATATPTATPTRTPAPANGPVKRSILPMMAGSSTN